MRRLAPSLLALALLGCSGETEVMLVIKAARSLSTGVGAQIDSVLIQGEPVTQDSQTYSKLVDLCAPALAPSPTCRPEKFVAADYEGQVTLPLHILMRPGALDADTKVRVDILAQQTVTSEEGSLTRSRLRTHVEFQFSPHRRLWLDVPLYAECLDQRACEAVNQFCKADCPPGDDGQTPAYCCGFILPSEEENPSDPPSPDLSVPMDLAPLPPPPDFAVVCGHAGDSCCPGDTCIDANDECVGSYCSPKSTTCGVPGKPCCGAPGPACVSPAVCDVNNICQPPCGGDKQTCCAPSAPPQCKLTNEQCFADSDLGTCEHCGTDMSTCCPGMNCNLSLVCSSTTCTPCGQTNEPCCVPSLPNYPAGCDKSNSTLLCSGGLCKTCGTAVNAPCCPGGHCTSPTLACNGVTCQDCGGMGELCCSDSGNSCNTGFTCSNMSCVPCGGLGQLCCASGMSCNGGLTCNGGTGTCLSANPDAGPPPCGGNGQMCCMLLPECQGGYSCQGGTCLTCGVSGKPCCPGADMCSCMQTTQSLRVGGGSQPAQPSTQGTICP